MPRPPSPELLKRLENAEETLGVSLAKLCVKARLPILYVAVMLGVSRMTLHTWFRGGSIRDSRTTKIKAFMQLINDDIRDGLLPKRTLDETKEYAEAFSGKPILTSGMSKLTAVKAID